MKSIEKLKLAINASLKAAVEINKIYQSENFNLKFKKDNSPLTKADLASNDIIKSELNKSNIPILSEEGEMTDFAIRKNWNELWIVDPIDGTKEFIKRNGEFTVNIALIKNKTPIIGVIYAPVLKTLYYSSNKIGAFKFGNLDVDNYDLNEILSKSDKLPLASENKIYTVVASRSHMSEETKQHIQKIKKSKGDINLISSGSSLKMCLVAEGKADEYPRFAPTMEWDTAAGHCICQQSGYDLIDLKTNRTMLYNRENLLNNWFLIKKTK